MQANSIVTGWLEVRASVLKSTLPQCMLDRVVRFLEYHVCLGVLLHHEHVRYFCLSKFLQTCTFRDFCACRPVQKRRHFEGEEVLAHACLYEIRSHTVYLLHDLLLVNNYQGYNLLVVLIIPGTNIPQNFSLQRRINACMHSLTTTQTSSSWSPTGPRLKRLWGRTYPRYSQQTMLETVKQVWGCKLLASNKAVLPN